MEDGKILTKLDILYEDNHLIVVNKPYNIPVQKDSSNDRDLDTLIKNYLKEKYHKPGNVYLGLIHRLDRPVSGVMVFAKTSKAAKRLSEQIQKHLFHKTYLAVVNGKTLKRAKLIDKISKEKNNFKSYIDEENGKESILEYQLLEYNLENNLSLLKINLLTGRHHQIRLQLSNQNYPIYGDNWYGLKEKAPIHLISYKLEFLHPVTQEKMTFTVKPELKDKWLIFSEVIKNLK